MAVLVFCDAGWCGWPFQLRLLRRLALALALGLGLALASTLASTLLYLETFGEGGDAGKTVGEEGEGY